MCVYRQTLGYLKRRRNRWPTEHETEKKKKKRFVPVDGARLMLVGSRVTLRWSFVEKITAWHAKVASRVSPIVAESRLSLYVSTFHLVPKKEDNEIYSDWFLSFCDFCWQLQMSTFLLDSKLWLYSVRRFVSTAVRHLLSPLRMSGPNVIEACSRKSSWC